MRREHSLRAVATGAAKDYRGPLRLFVCQKDPCNPLTPESSLLPRSLPSRDVRLDARHSAAADFGPDLHRGSAKQRANTHAASHRRNAGGTPVNGSVAPGDLRLWSRPRYLPAGLPRSHAAAPPAHGARRPPAAARCARSPVGSKGENTTPNSSSIIARARCARMYEDRRSSWSSPSRSHVHRRVIAIPAAGGNSLHWTWPPTQPAPSLLFQIFACSRDCQGNHRIQHWSDRRDRCTWWSCIGRPVRRT